MTYPLAVGALIGALALVPSLVAGGIALAHRYRARRAARRRAQPLRRLT